MYQNLHRSKKHIDFQSFLHLQYVAFLKQTDYQIVNPEYFRPAKRAKNPNNKTPKSMEI